MQRAHRLDEHIDGAAARKPHGEGELVADPVVHDARPTVVQDGHRLFIDGGFDTAVAHRARDLVSRSCDERRTERPRRRAGDADDRRDRRGLPGGKPLLEFGRNFLHRAAASAAAGSFRKRRRHPSPQK